MGIIEIVQKAPYFNRNFKSEAAYQKKSWLRMNSLSSDAAAISASSSLEDCEKWVREESESRTFWKTDESDLSTRMSFCSFVWVGMRDTGVSIDFKGRTSVPFICLPLSPLLVLGFLFCPPLLVISPPLLFSLRNTDTHTLSPTLRNLFEFARD